MKLDTLHDLFIHLLQDSHSAEEQLIEALPAMAKHARHPDLQLAFETHLAETREHLSVVEGLLKTFRAKAATKKCAAMAGIIREGKEFLEAGIEPRVRDVALIAAAQRAEHYEIAAYGTLVAYSSVLGETAAGEALEELLKQERATDELLSMLSDTLNPLAATGEDVVKSSRKA